MKTYSKTPKNKENVNQNYVEYILRLHFVKVTWCHLGWHYNVTWVTLQCHLGDITMSLRVTVKRWTYHTYDNAQRHVTAFWPISEAAQKWFHGPTRVHTPNTFGLHCAESVPQRHLRYAHIKPSVSTYLYSILIAYIYAKYRPLCLTVLLGFVTGMHFEKAKLYTTLFAIQAATKHWTITERNKKEKQTNQSFTALSHSQIKRSDYCLLTFENICSSANYQCRETVW